MQNRAVFRAYCLLLGFLVILFLGLSLAKAWAIPEPAGVDAGAQAAEPLSGWRLRLHLADGRTPEYWLSGEVPADDPAAGGLAWQLSEPYLPLRLLAESAGAHLGWFEYHNGSIHTGAVVWWQPEHSVIWLPDCAEVFFVRPSADGVPPQVEPARQFARPQLLADTFCLPVQLLEVLGWEYTFADGQVEVYLPDDWPAEVGEAEAQAQIEAVWQAAQPYLAEFWADELGNRLLAAAETSFDPALAGRTQNIFLAAQSLHGWQAAPGAEFSFNKVVGERTPERGYALATIFMGKQPVQGYGGGVCQVSSTLYMALRQTELNVLERHPHSLPVTYAPAGADATVAWNALDLRWRNDLPEPVFLLCQINGGSLRIEIWQGQPPIELPSIF